MEALGVELLQARAIVVHAEEVEIVGILLLVIARSREIYYALGIIDAKDI